MPRRKQERPKHLENPEELASSLQNGEPKEFPERNLSFDSGYLLFILTYSDETLPIPRCCRD
ncbi:hypothetical protein AVEN_115730-1, partial [Araneus ventricosus]